MFHPHCPRSLSSCSAPCWPSASILLCCYPLLSSPRLLLGGPLLSSSSHCTLSFLCASFFCRSLKPPSFITQWTGSRYCTFLATLSGASAQPGGRPPALGKVWDVDPGEAFVPRQVYCDPPPSRQDRAPKSTGCSFGEKPQVPPLEARLYQVPGRHGSLGFLPPEQGPLLRPSPSCPGGGQAQPGQEQPKAGTASEAQGARKSLGVLRSVRPRSGCSRGEGLKGAALRAPRVWGQEEEGSTDPPALTCCSPLPAAPSASR